MAEEREIPALRNRAPTFRLHRSRLEASATGQTRPRRSSVFRRERRNADHVNRPRPRSIYQGSYRLTAPILRSTYLHPGGTDSPRTSVSHLQLQPLLAGLGEDTKSYGLHDLRDGLFDATFIRPSALEERGSFVDSEPDSDIQSWLGRQQAALKAVLVDITTTRSGIRLLKAFLAYFVCYILCLVPTTGTWLGFYNHLAVVSVLVNHPGRSIGSQLDGALFSCAGVIVGLLWAALAVWLSTATAASQAGFGAVVTPFLVTFSLSAGWLRCVMGRFYQAVLASGIAFFYMALSQNYSDPAAISPIIWSRFADFIIPWAVGQAVCLFVCIAVFPSAGNRPLAIAFHTALISMRHALVLPRPSSATLDRDLASHFVNVSQATRDFTMDATFSRFSSTDATSLRNLFQGVLRALLALRPDSNFFAELSRRNTEPESMADVVTQMMAPPTWDIVKHSQQAIDMVDFAIIETSGLKYGYSAIKLFRIEDVKGTLQSLRDARACYDEMEESLNNYTGLWSTDNNHSEVVSIFTFMQPIRQLADKMILLLEYALILKERKLRWKFQLPTYPWSKAFFRMNPTVRHDRGGLTAGNFFHSKRQLERTMNELQNKTWVPLNETTGQSLHTESITPHARRRSGTLGRRFLFGVWLILHRMQDFEARFAVKKMLVCLLLSTAAFLPQSSGWWYSGGCWWAIVSVWIMLHPRVGGNLTDLSMRCACAAAGAVWGGCAYAARDGHPVVMAAFMVIFIVPMLYRYTVSAHPRSGIIGCLSFTVVSLITYDRNGTSYPVDVAWTRGLSILVGTAVTITVNWILWPFNARHELRKSLATMILHCSLIYRRIVSQYIYYDEGDEPSEDDIRRSEMLEGRLREGFLRVRQLIGLTKHEIRLRGPFEPKPYAALIDCCESFFDRLIDVRQTSLFFKGDLMGRVENQSHNLAALRRDAVASILMVLYILAGALREKRPLPRYIPSSALARQRLLDTMDVVRAEQERRNSRGGEAVEGQGGGKSWTNVYQYAYSAALTDCVEQVQQLVVYTRRIVGEVGLPEQ